MENIGVSDTLPDDSTFQAFWKRFSLFSSKFDAFCLKYWYLFLLGFCLVLLLLDLSLDYHNHLNLGIIASLVYRNTHYYKVARHDVFSYTSYDLTNAILISQGVALALEALAFNRWCKRVPLAFHELFARRHICCLDSTKSLSEEYFKYLADYQQTLKSHKRFLFVAALFLLVLIIGLITIIPRIAQIFPTNDLFSNLIMVIRWPLFELILCGFLIAYIVAVGLWVTAVTGRYIRKLTREFHLTILATHPDKCGGLKFLGSFCLNMALPILIAIVILGIYGIGFALFYQRISTVFLIAANAFLVLVALPIAIFAFLVPLWDIHLRMVNIREETEDKLSNSIMGLEQSMQTALEKQDWDQFKDIKEKLVVIAELLTDNFGYLTWPFNIRILLIFLTPQLITLMSVIVGFDQNGPLATALKALLSIIGVGSS